MCTFLCTWFVLPCPSLPEQRSPNFCIFHVAKNYRIPFWRPRLAPGDIYHLSPYLPLLTSVIEIKWLDLIWSHVVSRLYNIAMKCQYDIIKTECSEEIARIFDRSSAILIKYHDEFQSNNCTMGQQTLSFTVVNLVKYTIRGFDQHWLGSWHRRMRTGVSSWVSYTSALAPVSAADVGLSARIRVN